MDHDLSKLFIPKIKYIMAVNIDQNLFMLWKKKFSLELIRIAYAYTCRKTAWSI